MQTPYVETEALLAIIAGNELRAESLLNSLNGLESKQLVAAAERLSELAWARQKAYRQAESSL